VRALNSQNRDQHQGYHHQRKDKEPTRNLTVSPAATQHAEYRDDDQKTSIKEENRRRAAASAQGRKYNKRDDTQCDDELERFFDSDFPQHGHNSNIGADTD
jgi:hypothetical protein